MPAIRAGRPPGEAFRAVARATLAGLARDLASAGEGGGVHGARRRLKFMRSLLRLVRPSLGKAEFGRADRLLGEAADALAGARRAEALQEAVVKLGQAHPAAKPALAELAALMAGLHREHATAEALGQSAALALRNCRVLRGEVSRWRLARRDTALFLDGLKDCYRKARRRLRRGLAAKDVAILHQARKQIIHHLHQLDMLRALWPEMIRVWTAELTDLRGALGDLNDLDEITGLIEKNAAAFSSPAARGAVDEAIASRRKELLKKAAKRGNHLFAESPSAFAGRIGAMWQATLE